MFFNHLSKWYKINMSTPVCCYPANAPVLISAVSTRDIHWKISMILLEMPLIFIYDNIVCAILLCSDWSFRHCSSAWEHSE